MPAAQLSNSSKPAEGMPAWHGVMALSHAYGPWDSQFYSILVNALISNSNCKSILISVSQLMGNCIIDHHALGYACRHR